MATTPVNVPSKKEAWAQWDEAREHRLASEARHLRLIAATAPGFCFRNMESEFYGDDLDRLVVLLESMLHTGWDKLRIRHINWYEHSNESAVQWEVVNKKTGAVVSKGWSHATYAADGKLQSVSDFY